MQSGTPETPRLTRSKFFKRAELLVMERTKLTPSMQQDFDAIGLASEVETMERRD